MINGTGSVIDVKKKRGKCEIRVKTDIPAVDVYLTESCDAAAVFSKGDSISFNGQINKVVIYDGLVKNPWHHHSRVGREISN